MTTTALTLPAQIIEDVLIFNAVAPGAAFPIEGATAWGREDFAQYAFTLGGNLFPFYPTETNNPAGFIDQVFENALGRHASQADQAFYGHLIAEASGGKGWAEVILFVGLSQESREHNVGLLAHFA